MNAFQRAAAMHSAASDAVFGESVRFEPQAEGGYMTASQADPARQAREVRAIVMRPATIVGRKGEGSDAGDNARVVASHYAVTFDAPLARRLDVRPDDIVALLEEPGQPRLRLGQPQPVTGRTIFPAEPVA